MNSGYKDYARLAYRRTIIAEIQRFVKEHVNSEVPAIRTLICEEVLAADRLIPEEAYFEILEDLQLQEHTLQVQLTDFEIRRKDGRPKEETALLKSAESTSAK